MTGGWKCVAEIREELGLENDREERESEREAVE